MFDTDWEQLASLHFFLFLLSQLLYDAKLGFLLIIVSPTSQNPRSTLIHMVQGDTFFAHAWSDLGK